MEKPQEHFVNVQNPASKIIWIESNAFEIFAPIGGRLEYSVLPGILFTVTTFEGVVVHVGTSLFGSARFDFVPLYTLDVMKGDQIYALKPGYENWGAFNSFIGVTGPGQVLRTPATAGLGSVVNHGVLLWGLDSTSTTLRRV